MNKLTSPTEKHWVIEAPNPKIVIFALVVFFILSSLLFLKTKFPIFNDEALYSEMVLRFTQGLGLSTPLFRDFIPFVERYAYWYPPLYFLTLAPIYLVFGAHLVTMRLFSLACGLLALGLMYRLARKTLVFSYSTVLLLAILISDPQFQDSSIVGRMEILCLVWGLAALLAHWRGFKNSFLKWNFSAGLFAALSLLTHPTGAIIIVPIGLNLFLAPRLPIKQKIQSLLCFSLPIVLGLALWAASFWPHFDIFLLQNQLQLHRKEFNDYYIIESLRFKPLHRLILLVYIFSNAWFCLKGIIKKSYTNSANLLLLLLAFTSLVFTILLKELWYAIYLSVFGAFFLIKNLEDFWQRKIYWPAVFFAIVLVVNSVIYFEGISQINQVSESYEDFGQKLADQLPTNAKVLLISFPDPYFYFTEHRPDLQLRETPNSPIKEPIDVAVYALVLEDVDYAIVSYFPNQHLNQYFQNNLETVVYDNQGNGNNPAMILKLKPVKDRLPLAVEPDLQWQYPTLPAK